MNSLKEKSQAYFNTDVNVLNIEDAKIYNGSVLIDDIDEILTLLLRMALENNNLNISGVVINI